LPNEVEVSLYCDAIGIHIADLVRRKYVFGVALKVEVLPRRQVLSGETESLRAEAINHFRNKIGTKRTYRDDLLLVRFRGEPDMHDDEALTASVANDP
jgi:hypothetical protein